MSAFKNLMPTGLPVGGVAMKKKAKGSRGVGDEGVTKVKAPAKRPDDIVMQTKIINVLILAGLSTPTHPQRDVHWKKKYKAANQALAGADYSEHGAALKLWNVSEFNDKRLYKNPNKKTRKVNCNPSNTTFFGACEKLVLTFTANEWGHLLPTGIRRLSVQYSSSFDNSLKALLNMMWSLRDFLKLGSQEEIPKLEILEDANRSVKAKKEHASSSVTNTQTKCDAVENSSDEESSSDSSENDDGGSSSDEEDGSGLMASKQDAVAGLHVLAKWISQCTGVILGNKKSANTVKTINVYLSNPDVAPYAQIVPGVSYWKKHISSWEQCAATEMDEFDDSRWTTKYAGTASALFYNGTSHIFRAAADEARSAIAKSTLQAAICSWRSSTHVTFSEDTDALRYTDRMTLDMTYEALFTASPRQEFLNPVYPLQLKDYLENEGLPASISAAISEVSKEYEKLKEGVVWAKDVIEGLAAHTYIVMQGKLESPQHVHLCNTISKLRDEEEELIISVVRDLKNALVDDADPSMLEDDDMAYEVLQSMDKLDAPEEYNGIPETCVQLLLMMASLVGKLASYARISDPLSPSFEDVAEQYESMCALQISLNTAAQGSGVQVKDYAQETVSYVAAWFKVHVAPKLQSEQERLEKMGAKKAMKKWKNSDLQKFRWMDEDAYIGIAQVLGEPRPDSPPKIDASHPKEAAFGSSSVLSSSAGNKRPSSVLSSSGAEGKAVGKKTKLVEPHGAKKKSDKGKKDKSGKGFTGVAGIAMAEPE